MTISTMRSYPFYTGIVCPWHDSLHPFIRMNWNGTPKLTYALFTNINIYIFSIFSPFVSSFLHHVLSETIPFSTIPFSGCQSWLGARFVGNRWHFKRGLESGLSAVCDCSSPWTFLLTFLENHFSGDQMLIKNTTDRSVQWSIPISFQGGARWFDL